MKIHELITMLQQYDSNKEIVATWECQIRDIDVYEAADGRVMVDVDDNHYKVRWQETKCEICGKLATGTPFGNPRCYEHWNSPV